MSEEQGERIREAREPNGGSYREDKAAAGATWPFEALRALRSLLRSAIIAREGGLPIAPGGSGQAVDAGTERVPERVTARAGTGTESRVSPPFPSGTIMISHGACNEP